MFVPVGLYAEPAERRHFDELAEAGADLFEIGLPIEDALCDGPVIQAAYHRVLRGQNAVDRAVSAVTHAAGLRPTVVMTHWEPVRSHGPERPARAFRPRSLVLPDGSTHPPAPPSRATGAHSTSQPSPTSPGSYEQRAGCRWSRAWGSPPQP